MDGVERVPLTSTLRAKVVLLDDPNRGREPSEPAVLGTECCLLNLYCCCRVWAIASGLFVEHLLDPEARSKCCCPSCRLQQTRHSAPSLYFHVVLARHSLLPQTSAPKQIVTTPPSLFNLQL